MLSINKVCEGDNMDRCITVSNAKGSFSDIIVEIGNEVIKVEGKELIRAIENALHA